MPTAAVANTSGICTRPTSILPNSSLSDWPKSPRDFVKMFEPAPYSAARLVGLKRVIMLDFHISRLVKSFKLISGQRSLGVIPTFDRVRDDVALCIDNLLLYYRKTKASDSTSGDFMIIILACHPPKQDDNWSIIIHSHAMPPPKISANLCVLGGPRPIPEAKDTQWIWDREKLERQKGDFDEIILSDENGFLLEGLVSNVFIVTDEYILTAPDRVLFGHVRELVLKVCSTNNLKLKLEAPNIFNSSQWREAFITSTAQIVTPVQLIEFNRNDSELPAVHFDLKSNVCSRRIKKFVQDLINTSDC
eukprot:865318_1